jgi:LPS-assembly lipoprotein
MPRRFGSLAIVLALILGGCGFHPLYGDHATSGFDADLAAIKVNTIQDRLGQQLALSLRDGLNPTRVQVAPRYALDVRLDAARNDLGIRKDATASRTQMMIVAHFQLKELATDRTVLQGMTRTAVSFDSQTDEYANAVARQSAQERSLRDLSDDIRTRLAVHVNQHRSTARVN